MISIIIPCYNIELHLPKCIDSVLGQTFLDFELLLLDDGSSDGTLKICQEYQRKDSRIKVFNHNNRGVSYTRNRGIEKAQGDYIMFIDGDDWIENDTLSLLMAPALRSDTINVCGMVHERKGEIFENDFFKTVVAKNKVSYEKNEFISLFPSAILSSPCCKLYNRSIINTIRFDETSSYQEDLLFNLEYLQNINKIRIIPHFKYHYVEHQVSSSSRYHPNLNKSVTAVRKLLLTLPKYNSQEVSIQKFTIDQVLKIISNYMHKDSGLSLNDKYDGIKEIINSAIFEQSKDFLPEMNLGTILKFFLKRKNVTGILLYFQLNKLVNR